MIDQFGIDAVNANGEQPDLSQIGKGEPHDLPDVFKSVKSLSEHLGEYVRSFWMEGDEETRNDPERSFMPMLLAVCANGDVAPIGVGIEMNEENKELFLAKMREMFKEWGVVRYGFISECWVATYQGSPEQAGRTAPSDHPDREEIMSIIVTDLEGTTEARILKMVRDDRGVVVDLVLDEEKSHMGGNGTTFGGRFTSLLKEGEPAQSNGTTSVADVLNFVQRVLDVPEAMRNVFGNDFDSIHAEGQKILQRIRAAIGELQGATDHATAQVVQMKLNAHMVEVQGFMMRVKAIWDKRQPETDPDDTGVRH